MTHDLMKNSLEMLGYRVSAADKRSCEFCLTLLFKAYCLYTGVKSQDHVPCSKHLLCENTLLKGQKEPRRSVP